MLKFFNKCFFSYIENSISKINFFLLRFIFNFNFFSSNFLKFNLVFYVLFSFFNFRGLFFKQFIFFSSSFYESFYLLGFYFFLFKKNKFLGILSFENFLAFKFKLKLVFIKFSVNDFFSLLKLLNNEIFNWFLYYYYSDCFSSFILKLNFSLYKLFWRLVKKKHPRRANTWIFNKYWKFYNGFWVFSFLESSFKYPLFLFSNYKFISKFLSLPSSFEFLLVLNEFKFNKVWFFRHIFLFRNFLRLLWVKQFARCFFCFRFFEYISKGNLVILYFKGIFFSSNKFCKIVLVHKSCI